METKARQIGISKDWVSGKYQVVFEVNREPEQIDGDIRLIYKRWREKRSLDANSYMWAIIHEMAVALDSTKDEVYEELIQRHGYMDRDDSGYITITMRADIDKSHLPGHWKLDDYSSTIDWKVYRRIRGTSEYDTKEMSYFLDRVIEEAKELGIDTMTEDEKLRLKGYERQLIHERL